MPEKACLHCSTPFLPNETEADFCCAGCHFVYDLLNDEGLDQFYQLKGDSSGRPVKERPFQTPQLDWLTTFIDELPSDETQHSLRLRLSGVTCIGCVWLIEKLFLRETGAIRVAIHPATAEAEFTWESDSQALQNLAHNLPRYGYLLENPDTVSSRRRESQSLLPRLGLCAAFALNTMGFALPRYLGMDDSFAYASLFDLIALISSTFTLLLGGSYFFIKAFAALRERTIHIDLPIALGLLFAYLGSMIGWLTGETELLYFDFVAIFTSLMLGGRYLHLAATERAQNQLQGQAAITPQVTLSDGSQKPTKRLKSGDTFTLPPGQALPVTAKLHSPSSDFSLAWMTGEPDPQTYPSGRRVPAGAIPLASDPVTLQADEDYADSLVSKLSDASAQPNQSAKTSRILKYYLLTVLLIGIGTGITRLALGIPPLETLQTIISIFVISCPCALGVAIPLCDRRAASALAKLGVYIQNPQIWTHLRRIQHLVFDKTGTLTLEHPQLINPAQIHQLTPSAQSALYQLSAHSLHPLSRILHQHLESHQSSDRPLNSPAQAHPGLGSSLVIDNKYWTLGKPGWRGHNSFTPIDTDNMACELACDGELITRFDFQESLRPQARQAIRQLTSRENLQLHILSGDQASRIAPLAADLGIPAHQAHGSLSPEDKESLVSQLKPSLYLGDGMNDTLAFSASTLTGTPVADRSLLDRQADFLFTCPGLAFLPQLFSVAHWRYHTTSLILAFTLLYNASAIGACLTGHMTPLLAAILMPLSSLASLAIASRSMIKRKPLFIAKTNSSQRKDPPLFCENNKASFSLIEK